MEILQYMLIPILNIKLLLLVASGVLLGIYVGAIPGLSVTMATALLISFTFSWDTYTALAFMIGVYCGGVYGGSRSSILLNIPGAPAAVATGFDGYPLAQKGLAAEALGVTVVESVLGGFIGVIILAIAAKPISNISLMFSPMDFFLLAFMGIMLVGSLGTDSVAKGIFAGGIGLMAAFVGIDYVTGQGRFTFGSLKLMSGINYTAVMIGGFGLSEAFIHLRDLNVEAVKQNVKKIVPSWGIVKKHMPLAIRTSLIGTFIGALPGSGGDIASLLAYDHAKRTTRNPEVPFGKGAIEGIVAPESANNAAVGGAFIPMLMLGIPGDAVTAILIGALFIHGFRPGPMLMIDSPNLIWMIVGSLFLANIFLLIFGMTGIKTFCKIVEVPKSILMPIIIVLSVVGSFTINNNLMDVFWMAAFGFLGYILKMYNFAVGPIVLGIILGPLLEQNLRRAVAISRNNLLVLFTNMITSPITFVLLVSILVMILSQSEGFKAKIRSLRSKGSKIED